MKKSSLWLSVYACLVTDLCIFPHYLRAGDGDVLYVRCFC